jgi:dienelactone hydrolase
MRPAILMHPDWLGVCHHSIDIMTPKPMMNALEIEMTKANVDLQIMMFGHAVHSVRNKEANTETLRYDAKPCNQSYRMIRDFFEEKF